VALLASLREAGSRVVRVCGFGKIGRVTRHARGGEPSELPGGRAFVARVTGQGGVRSD
jgi:hypothetical protein